MSCSMFTHRSSHTAMAHNGCGALGFVAARVWLVLQVGQIVDALFELCRSGQVFTDEGDFSARASEHIATHYAYGEGATILFKPTLAAEDQFRETTEEALSYFVGTEGTEDGGFAIAPYTAVRWENNGTVISDSGDMAVAMGNYFFTGTDGNETKVEYSFAYEKDDNGDLKIVLHHSSLPFSAN